MYPLILAAILSFDQIVQEFDDFCVKAEIEVSHPITPEMAKSRPPFHEDTALVRIGERYSMDYYASRVRGFQDDNESGARKLSRLDPAEMQSWSEERCLIDEAGAKDIAARLFRRLGFDEKQFDPVEVHRYSWQPSEQDPEHVLHLPLFWVMWYRRGLARGPTSPSGVQMDISGTTKKLVHYLDSTDDDIPFLGLFERLRCLPSQHRPADVKRSSAAPLGITLPVGRFFNAVGMHPSGEWKQQAQASDPPPPTIVQVQNRYLFTVRGDCVDEFCDREQNISALVVEANRAGVSNWMGVATIITETQAVQIATSLLLRLGFDKQAFYPAELRYDETPANDPSLQPLPTFYTIRWVGKRPSSARGGLPEIVEMEISGANSNLVHYWYAPNTFRFQP